MKFTNFLINSISNFFSHGLYAIFFGLLSCSILIYTEPNIVSVSILSVLMITMGYGIFKQTSYSDCNFFNSVYAFVLPFILMGSQSCQTSFIWLFAATVLLVMNLYKSYVLTERANAIFQSLEDSVKRTKQLTQSLI